MKLRIKKGFSPIDKNNLEFVNIYQVSSLKQSSILVMTFPMILEDDTDCIEVYENGVDEND